MSRKTFKVAELVINVNRILLHSDDLAIGERQGAIKVLETMLLDTSNYKGFDYLTSADMLESKNGTSVGVREFDAERSQFNFDDTDSTRVRYQ